ncbi:alpha-ketoacid dehydrogenase subunit beta [Litorilinea aerophila]|uniref:Alpha-ketoacid dehydrogenase subunit beta n=1 Tax=Litorilinea aerophila TaxID=1204385 RepID=A0A540V900_9CHLR|nr:alpha-ketoacid dehydrogenase subunit beta [Litorilinea aerophila]MCC9078817.1 alpha-ketoacid dehydrogenase subunit beta [Litorilinea aerophila]OUC06504.1 pyruvate dehydrogenase [Litorilinea aerophila]
MRKTTYIQAINEALREEMRRDESVFLIGEDVGHYGGLFRVTRNLLDEFGETRVIDTPISEQGFMGMAIGAAMVGMRPIVELMYMDFILVCADQVLNQGAKMHYMSGGLVKVPMVIRGQQGGGKRYGSQHSQCIDSLVAHFPGIKVVAPATPYDAKGLLISAIRDNNPVLYLEHKMLYFTRGELPDVGEEVIVPIGKADVKREGSDLTLVTFGYCLLQALEAAEELAEEHGIDIEVVDLRTIVPLDMETVLASVAKTGRLLAVHESQANCGIGGEIVARVYEEAPHLLQAPARRLGMAPVSIPVSQTLEEEILPWKRNIKAAVLEMWRQPVAA